MSSKKYEYLDHTADVKFRAYGKTLEEAFSNAALATSDVITDVSEVKKVLEKNIEILSKSKESLLYDFLQELIFLLDTEFFIASGIKEINIYEKDGFHLNATLLGDSCKNYKTKGDIKSATYNFMLIREEKDSVMVQAVLDI